MRIEANSNLIQRFDKILQHLKTSYSEGAIKVEYKET